MKSKIDFEKLTALFNNYNTTKAAHEQARQALEREIGVRETVHATAPAPIKGPRARKFRGNVTETVRQFVNASAAPVNASDVARAIGQGINSIQVAQAFQSLKARGLIIPTESRGYYFRRPVSPADVTNNAIAAH